MLDLLDHLVDKSLIISVQDGHGPRYRRLETIRQYAREKLAESGEGATYRNRHLAYFLKWVRDIELGLRGPQQVELLNRLENEIDNLRAVLERSQDSDPESGLQLASMLKWFWFLYGLFEEGTGWLENLLVSSKKTGTEISPLLQARSLAVLAWLSNWLGNIQSAQTSLDESQELCEKNPGSISDLIAGDNLYLNGALALGKGDLSQAKLLAEKALALYQAWDYKFGVAEMSGLLFGVALVSGDLETASRWKEAAVTIRKQIGDKDGLAYDLTTSAGIPFSKRDYGATKRRLTDAIEASKEAPNKFSPGLALGYFGITCLFEDNFGQALNCLSQLATLVYEKSHTPLKTLSLYYLALLLFEQKQYRTSTQLIGTLEGLKTYNIVVLYDMPIIHTARENYLLEAREILGETVFNGAYAEGRAMTLDQAIAYALKALGQ